MASTINSFMLECGLVRIPVALRGASEKRDVSLGRAAPYVIDTDDGPYTVPRRIVQMNVIDPGASVDKLLVDPLRRDKKGKIESMQFDGEPLRGVWEGDEFYEITPAEIEQIEQMTTLTTLTIQEFVPLGEVPWERAQASYFLAPQRDTGLGTLRTMATLKEAMAEKGVAGVAKLMPKSRQKLALIYPKHGGLMVTVLAYAETFDQVKQGAASIEGVEVNAEALVMTGSLVDAMAAPIEVLDEYRDDQIDLKSDLIERAKLGEPLVQEPTEEVLKAPVVASTDALMDALKRSVAEIKKSRKKAPAKKTSAAKGKKAAARS